MDSTALVQPQPTLQVPGQQQPRRARPHSEFDPCANAKVTSPFYLYNHDSPRQSYDYKPGPNIHISVTDLEAGETLTPTVSQEKVQRVSSDSGKFRLWNHRGNRCMTRPQKSWFKQLPHSQQLLIKILIALALIGIIVGVAVGISVRVHGGIWKNSNQTTSIGG